MVVNSSASIAYICSHANPLYPTPSSPFSGGKGVIFSCIRARYHIYIHYLSKGSASQGGVFSGLFQGDYVKGSLKEEDLLEIGIEGLLVAVPHRARHALEDLIKRGACEGGVGVEPVINVRLKDGFLYGFGYIVDAMEVGVTAGKLSKSAALSLSKD